MAGSQKSGLRTLHGRRNHRNLVEAFVEIGLVPWSTNGIEQLHAGAAQVHKYHPEFEGDSLACRSFLWAFNKLIQDSEEQRRLEAMAARLDRLQAALPLLVVLLRRC